MISRQGLLVLGVSLVVTLGSASDARAEQAKAPAAAQAAPTGAATPPKPSPPTAVAPSAQPAKDKPEQPKAEPSTARAAPPAEAAADTAANAEAGSTATAAPTGMPRGPSIYDTGRVGQLGVSDSGAKIKQAPDRAKPKETRVEEKTSAAEITPATTRPSGGVLNQAVFGRELRPRFALLRDCRIEVARQKRTSTQSVAASRLILRWTVLPDGTVTDTQVVATSPVDGRVTDCVKRQMSLWSFSPPTGGAAHVERPFKFQ